MAHIASLLSPLRGYPEFWGTYGAAHECMHVAGMPQRIAMIACDVSITFPHLYATCSHYMSHAMHIGDMLCLCVMGICFLDKLLRQLEFALQLYWYSQGQ